MNTIGEESAYIACNIIGILVMVALSYIAGRDVITSHKMKASFLRIVQLTIILLAVQTGAILSRQGRADTRIYSILWNMIEFSVIPVIPILIGLAFSNEPNRLEQLFMIPAVVNMLLVVLSPALGLIFSISADNVFARGYLYPVFGICTACSVFFLAYETIRLRSSYQSNTRQMILFPSLLILLAAVMQILAPELHTSFGALPAAILLYFVCLREQAASHDALTGLLNRQAYDLDLQDIEKRDSASVIVLDIDDFSGCVSTYGRPYGDKCLRALSDVIRTTFSPIGFSYRTGDDEFCVFCQTSNGDVIKKKADEFLTKIIQKREENKHLPMISTGFAVYIKGSEKLTDTIRRANEQMQYYKHQRESGAVIQKLKEME